MSRSDFASNEVVQDAVIRNIEIIGEATKKLPADVRDRIPTIEWKKIARMRDWLAHAYFRVDDEIIWDVFTNEVPGLLMKIEESLGGTDAPPES